MRAPLAASFGSKMQKSVDVAATIRRLLIQHAEARDDLLPYASRHF